MEKDAPRRIFNSKWVWFSKWYKTDKFRTISEDREHKLKQIGII
jgi:hypothetical protein